MANHAGIGAPSNGSVYVCNLPDGTDENMLAEYFGTIGLLKVWSLIRYYWDLILHLISVFDIFRYIRLVSIHFQFSVFKSEMDDGEFSNNILKMSYPFISLLKIKNKKLEMNPSKPMVIASVFV